MTLKRQPTCLKSHTKNVSLPLKVIICQVLQEGTINKQDEVDKIL